MGSYVNCSSSNTCVCVVASLDGAREEKVEPTSADFYQVLSEHVVPCTVYPDLDVCLKLSLDVMLAGHG